MPYIYEDRLNEDDFVNALKTLYNMTGKEREELGLKGMAYVQEKYDFQKFQQQWVDLIGDILERHGSWETRNGYQPWELKEIA